MEPLLARSSQRRISTITSENAHNNRVDARQENAGRRIEEVARAKYYSEPDRDYHAEKGAQQDLFQETELVFLKQNLNGSVSRQEPEQPKPEQKPEASQEWILHAVSNKEYFYQ
jgi:hypothetical protein